MKALPALLAHPLRRSNTCAVSLRRSAGLSSSGAAQHSTESSLMETVERAVVYTRVSTAKQATEGISLSGQITTLLADIEDQGWT